MTKVTHTPGPWITYKRSESSQLRFISRTNRPLPIARVEPVPDAYALTEDIEANASLIAAAPDLLEALERMTYLQSGGPVKSSDADKWLKEARAVIAKAKGEA